MHFARLTGTLILTVAFGGAAFAQSGANRFVLQDNGSWTTTDGDFISPQAVNGYGLVVSGEFGFSGTTEEIYLISYEGNSRIVYRDDSGSWNTTQENVVEATAVNGFENAVSGEFGFGAGEEILLWNRDGTNRMLFLNETTGSWTTTQENLVEAVAVNGYDLIVSGEFGYGPTEEIFFFAYDGSNRILYQGDGGVWTTTQENPVQAIAVNGFEMAASGEFGFGPTEEVFLLNQDGTNKVLFLNQESGSWTTADAFMSASAVNGYDSVVSGELGFGSVEEIFLRNQNGANRVLFQNDDESWSTSEGNFVSDKAVNGFKLMTSGRFMDPALSSVFLLD